MTTSPSPELRMISVARSMARPGSRSRLVAVRDVHGRWSGSSRSKGSQLVQDLTDRLVLGLHVLLNLKRGVEHCVGILVRGLCPRVGGGALHVLADDDDAEKD